MIGTAIKAMGRRGVIRGAIGLGAAIGIGAPGRVGGGLGQPMPPSGIPIGNPNSLSTTEPDHPPWLAALHEQAHAEDARRYAKPTFDGLDLDLAMIRSTSPAFKIVTQRVRDERRRVAHQSMWDKFYEGHKRWRKSLGI